VAGVETVIGAGIKRALKALGYDLLIEGLAGDEGVNPGRVESFFRTERPEYVFIASGMSGGIAANLKFPAELMIDNLLRQIYLIDAAHRAGVRKLLYLASSCCYPRMCMQPMKEEAILTGPLEPTNEPYALAKIAGIKMIESYRREYGDNFICGIPGNCFGPGDDFSPEDSHVIGALICRFHEAKIQGLGEVEIWGSGEPRREFIYSDDLGDACVFVMNHYEGLSPVNLGSGQDISIRDLALLIREIVAYEGSLRFDPSKPDGMPVKLLDSGKLFSLGWRSRVDFRYALQKTYDWFRQSQVVNR